ncbi:uncharacterized protein LOC108732549 [Agrilus planipennis]|uniref:Uncharacterized protein LOC108732549 n=1 Tax=Agrilus planipennis TaxID=224129 RepID=A0A7F5R457_AGRPL|nr:uncharacterized protein LOC108732549 [Agrilus planipennis]
MKMPFPEWMQRNLLPITKERIHSNYLEQSVIAWKSTTSEDIRTTRTSRDDSTKIHSTNLGPIKGRGTINTSRDRSAKSIPIISTQSRQEAHQGNVVGPVCQ